MRAIYFDKGLSLKDLPIPEPSGKEILIKINLAGVCRTDIEICKGYMNYSGVLGHEFVGVAANGKYEGCRVVGEINAGCGKCSWCLRGLERHCPNRTVLGILGRNGVFAEYCLLPERNIKLIPDNVPDEEAIFTEPLAAALEIREQIFLLPSLPVAVIGDGRLAYLVAQVIQLVGNPVKIFGKHPEKLIKFSSLGFDVAGLDAKGEDTRYPLVVECSGRPSGLKMAMDLLEPRGTLVLKSTYHELPQVQLSSFVIQEWTLIGSRCGPFVPALELLRRKAIKIHSLITDRFPLSMGIEALARASQSDAGKVLIQP